MTYTLEEAYNYIISRIKERFYLVEKTFNLNQRDTAHRDYFIDTVINVVCQHYEIPKELLLSSARGKYSKDHDQTSSEIRGIIAFILRELPEEPISTAAIGKKLNRDHSTIVLLLRNVNGRLQTNPNYKKEYDLILYKVNKALEITG